MVNAAAGGATALPPGQASEPAWSPDGRRIAFSTPSGDYWYSIAVMNADGSEAHLLTASHDDFSAAWSSDGGRIAFARDQTIWVVSADGSHGHKVSGGANGAEPTWAPGRATLAWGDAYDPPSYRSGGLFLASADGSGLVRIAGGDEVGLELRDARTGTVLNTKVEPGTALGVAMYARYIGVMAMNNGRVELRRFQADGSQLRTSVLPADVDRYSLAAATRFFVYATRRRILATDAVTGKTTVIAALRAPLVGVSVLGRRVIWGESLKRDRTRIRELLLPR